MTKISLGIDSDDVDLLFMALERYRDEEQRLLSKGDRSAKARAKQTREAGKKLWDQIQKSL